MNIEQYRALKEQEANQPQEQPGVVSEQVDVVDEKVEDVAPEQTNAPQEILTKIKIGDEEVDLEELKNGYMRQSDYTRKTQEVSRARKEAEEAIGFYEHLKSNPQIAQELQKNTPIPQNLDPTQSKVLELEAKMYDMMLEREIETLQNKYPDFEVLDVLEMASSKGMNNLEDAYHLVKSSKGQVAPDVDTLKEQIRQEILNELKAEKDTKSIISSNTVQAIPEVSIPTLSQNEAKVASMMGMTESDYIKWRDINKKK